MRVVHLTSIDPRGQTVRMTLRVDIERVLRRWQMGRLLGFEQLAAGRTNESFRVEVEQGTFVVRRSRVSKVTGAVVFEHDLNAALARQGVPVPEVIRDPAGASFNEIDGRLWTIARFMAGGHPERTESVARLGGRTLARFHTAAQAVRGHANLPPPENRVAASRACLDACEAVASLDQELGALVARTRSAVEAAAPAVAASGADPSRLVIHGSCRLSSLLVDGSELAAVLDLDGARLGTRAEDIAVALASFAKCRDGSDVLDGRLAAAFIDGYRSRGVLTHPEMDGLSGHLAQALLYAWTKRLQRTLGTTPIDRKPLARSLWRLVSAERAIAFGCAIC